MHRNDVLELHVVLWTVSQPNSKIFMIVVCLVSFHKIHIWRFMVGKFFYGGQPGYDINDSKRNKKHWRIGQTIQTRLNF